MTPTPLPPRGAGEIVVIGLGRSGAAAGLLLAAREYSVYACDDGDSAELATVAATLARSGIATQLGGHDATRISNAALVVVSPGIPPSATPLRIARTAGREVISEVELALRAAPGLRYIAVTGTNGKTTTTAIIGHVLRALGTDAPDAGNIGTPLCEVVRGPRLPDWVSLELSSFQLHDTPSVAPDVGVLTNLSADHLDRYASVTEYFADKAMLFRNATASARWVLNADDPASEELALGVRGEHVHFSLAGEAEGWFDRRAGTLVAFGETLIRRTELQLLGDHNVANALAASLAVMSAAHDFRTADSRVRIASALRAFRSMPNRLEIAGEWNEVQWINDSKATNVASTLVAVQGMTRPTVLLLGGRHKGEPYAVLAPAIAARVTRVIAFGEAAPIIASDLAGVVPVERVDGTFEAVMAAARAYARAGDAVLLSPACSSYDMFRNYVERGERFRALAKSPNG
ncbi:MAG: UDP-N-acetylmuramoyl-L-alanine--D-glutamate ligase [Gemmatimonadota bacterium]|nr:UDP-N-acetylmuramoyl-L-alanine--D-glutamate ligase [Gemmatimonadota bacterium]